MVDSLFRSWKAAALLAVGVSTLAAAFFADGGGHESFEESAAQIRDRHQGNGQGPVMPVNPGPVINPVPVNPDGSPVVVASEEAEPEFGAPMDGEPSPSATPTPAAKPAAAGEGEEDQSLQQQP